MRIALAAAMLAATCIPAAAQDWPTRPMTMVIPFAAGGGTDIVGRIIAARLSEILKQQVVVENVGGAGGMTGTARVAKAPPDGYQFVLGNVGTHAHNQLLHKSPLYNAATDFAAVGLIVDLPVVMVARKDLPPNNLREFIAYAKANQATMTFSSGGAGSSSHLACALLNAAIGVKVTHVPYRGGGPAMADLLAGRNDYQCSTVGTTAQQIATGDLKALALLTRDRVPTLPKAATAHEQGLKDFTADFWIALFLPRGTPAPIVRKLNAATIAAMDSPSVRERFRAVSALIAAPERRSPEYLQTFVGREIEKYAGPIKAAGLAGG